MGYLPELDGLRAIAVLSVIVFHHDYWLKGGFLGVDLFFVLSGFLITRLLLEEARARGSIDWRRFYARRALRLLPALIPVLALDWIAHGDAKPAATALFYASNWVRALRAPVAPETLGYLEHTWSLSIEEQFYWIWPWILMLCLGKARGSRRLLGLTAVLALASCASRVYLWEGPGSFARVYNGLDTRAEELLAGALAAQALALWPRLRVPALGGAMAFAVLAVFTVQARVQDGGMLTWGISAVAVSAALLILSVVQNAGSGAWALLRTAPMRWIGKLSYGMYLWHVPVNYIYGYQWEKSALETLVERTLLTILAAAVSYHAVEKPFLRIKERFSSRVKAPTKARTRLKAA